MPAERASAIMVGGGRPGVPSIGLVLGGGGARGLAHILMLEVFDELGLRPKIIAGTSIGAIFGAAYASGLAAADIRAHTVDVLTRRFGLVRDLLFARAQSGSGFWNIFSARSALLAPSALLDVVLPRGVARDFADLEIPLRIIASDYYALEPAVLSSGPLRRAVAASMALPAIFEPVNIDGRTMIDGGLTNPLPFDVIEGEADILVAIDVTGVTVPSEKRAHPTALEAVVRIVVPVRALDRAREAQTSEAGHLYRCGYGTVPGARFSQGARHPGGGRTGEREAQGPAHAHARGGGAAGAGAAGCARWRCSKRRSSRGGDCSSG